MNADQQTLNVDITLAFQQFKSKNIIGVFDACSIR